MSIRRVVPIEQAEWHIAPPPAWVVPSEPDWSFEPESDEGLAFLLTDEQHDVATQCCWQRLVRRLLSVGSVQALSQVEIDFDPAAHRLLIHELAVWRKQDDGSWHRRSLASRESFMLRQRERQLEQQILNGYVSVVALLEDVRVGDAIDLAWTLELRDALADLRFTTYYTFAWSVPVARATLTIHLDDAAPSRWRLHSPEGETPPSVVEACGRLQTSVERPTPFEFEYNTPAEYWPFSVLEISNWHSWAEVAQFFGSLWADALADGPEEIAAFAASLRRDDGISDEITRAIRFVQEEVRYLAVDFGSGSGMLPNGAATVLRRRFGDCKDKSVLLAALLRRMGIEAWPFLVSSGWEGAVARLQPSASCFSHAIVTFQHGGERHFVDPTVLGQRGDLSHMTTPSFGCGLEVRPDATALLALSEPEPVELTLVERFELDHRHQQGRVEQTLSALGGISDDLRAALSHNGTSTFFDARFDELQQHFPALARAELAPEVIDDEVGNRLELRCSYHLPTWGAPGTKRPSHFEYGAHGLFLAVESVNKLEQRRTPWALRYPMKALHRVVVRGKCVQKVKAESYRFEGPGFIYTCHVKPGKREITFDYRWETTQRAVPAEQWEAYCRARDEALDNAGWARVATARSFEWRHIALWAAILAVLVGARYFQQADRADPEQIVQVVNQVWDAYRNKNYVDAQLLIPQVEAHFRDNHDFQILRAEVGTFTGKYDQARDALQRARELRSDLVSPDIVEANLLIAQGKPQEARDLLLETVKRFPAETGVYLTLALATQSLGDTNAARRAWEMVLIRQPGQADALFNLAFLKWKAGEQTAADAIITGAIAALPAPSAVLESTLSRYYRATGRVQEAIAPARRALDLEPGNPENGRRYVMALLHSGDRASAVEEAQALTLRMPDAALAWNSLATAAAVSERPRLAEPAFRRWLEIAPNEADAHSSFGFFLHREGRSQEARRVLELATHAFPGSGVVWLNYAVVLQAVGETDAARRARKKADTLLSDEQRATLLR